MTAVHDQTFKWLDYYESTASDPFTANVVKDPKKAPERPEAFDILLQLRRFSLSWSDGGYEDQPWLLTEELNAAASAEEDHKNLIIMNQRRKAEFERDHAKTTSKR